MSSVSRFVLAASALASCFVVTTVRADVLGTATVTDANHYGYYGFASTSAQNTKVNVGPFTGTARVIRVSGTITRVHPDAWVSSIRVYPRSSAIATGQGWFQFSNLRDFPQPTVNVSATIYAPGGFSMAQPLNLEMYSIDSEQFVPGLDARSTLTYTFEDSFAPGTAEYSGRLETTDPRFNRPVQFPSSGPTGWTEPFLTNRFPHYDVQPFHVDTAGRYDLATANEFECGVVLYRNTFDPASPLANVMWAFDQGPNVVRNNQLNNLPFNDDATGTALIPADLVPGVQYYFVTTAYAAPGDPVDGGPFIGRYNNIITGVGNVTLGLVPEPTCGVMVASLGCVALLRHRKGN